MKLIASLLGSALIFAGSSAVGSPEASVWSPHCRQLGCIEEAVATLAPMGAELAFSICEGQGRSTYRYVRKSQGWELVARSAELEPDCEASVQPD